MGPPAGALHKDRAKLKEQSTEEQGEICILIEPAIQKIQNHLFVQLYVYVCM